MLSNGSNISNLINDIGYIESSKLSICLSSGNEIHILNDGDSIAYIDCTPILTCIGDPVTSAFLDAQNNIHIHLSSGVQHIVDINPVLQNTNNRLTELENKDYVYRTDLTSYVNEQTSGLTKNTDLSAYYTKTDIDNFGFLTAHQSLDNFATNDDVIRIENQMTSFVHESTLTSYYTKDEVDSAIQQIEFPSLDQYVTTDQLTSYTSDFINNDVLSAYALSSDIPTITYDGKNIHDLLIKKISKEQLDQYIQSGYEFLSNEVLIVDYNDCQNTTISSNDGIIKNLIITKLTQQEFYDKVISGIEFLSNEITIVNPEPSLNLYGSTIKNLSVDVNPDDYDAVNKKYVDEQITTALTDYCTSVDVRQIVSQIMNDEINTILDEPM